MAIAQPDTTDPLNVPDHAKLHSVIAADLGSAVKATVVDSSSKFQNVFWVGPDNAFTTIDAAINAASAGDTILVSPGTYTETITYDVDNLTIKSTGGKENTTITQAATTVVDFSTKEGCVLEGFTVNLSAADATTDYAIDGASDTSNNTANIIRNCDIVGTSSANLAGWGVVHITDGDYDFINCNITGSLTGDFSGQFVMGLWNLTAAGVINFTHCNFNIDNARVGVGHTYGIYGTAGSTINIRDCRFDVDSTCTTTGETFAIDGSTSVFTYNIYNSYIHAKTTSTGLAKCLSLTTGDGTINSYNNICYAYNSDGDQEWANVASGETLNSYNDKVVLGALTNAGTANIYGTLPAGDAGYMAVSTAATGGSGSAGAGKQYVELVINGVTYKALTES